MLPEDSRHPIFAESHEFAVHGFHFKGGRGFRDAYVDVTFVRGSTTRRLRFLAPQGVSARRLPLLSGGAVILDVSAREMPGIHVAVTDLEGPDKGLSIFARDVVDLDAADAADAAAE